MSSEEQQEYKGKNPEGKGLLKRLETSGILNHHEAEYVSFGHDDKFKLYSSVFSLLLLAKSYSEKRVGLQPVLYCHGIQCEKGALPQVLILIFGLSCVKSEV